VTEADGLGKSYGAKHVFSSARFTIERGDRVALVGVNGAGKSTLIKLLSGAELPTAGTVKLGHNVVSEYFAQDQYKVLDGEARMLDDMSRAALKVPESELRSLLGCFLFSGDDVFKPLGVLSGGERNRYALARILVSPSNFLLLDEPTNHLDMRAKDVLLDAIAAFSGTVVFVSHDRYFIDRLATRVIEVENGVITSYPGNYEDYLRKKEELAAASALDEAISTKEIPNQGSNSRPGAPSPVAYGMTIVIEGGPEGSNGALDSGRGTDSRTRRLNPIKQKQMEERCGFLEEEIPRVEASIAHTEEQLGVYVSAAETQRLTELAASLRKQLRELTDEWEELMLQLEGA
jgi:ATP-binding cassette subfamily F protein 3